MNPRVLLVEDDVARGRALVEALSGCCECRHVRTVPQVMAALRQGRWAALIVNHRMAGADSGTELMQIAREALPHTFRLIYSDSVSPSLERDAIRLLDPHFVGRVDEPGFIESLRRELERLLDPSVSTPSDDVPAAVREALVVCAPASHRFALALCHAAGQEGPVYIHGEPGTGVNSAGALLRQLRRERRPGAVQASADGQVWVLRVPPLRERPQDMAALAARCLGEIGGATPHRLSPRALQDLLARDWYGNLVELSATLTRAVQRTGGRSIIDAEDLPRDTQPAWRPSQFAKDAGQRDCVLRQLRVARNVSAAARLEGCSRANYIRLMRRLGIIRADLALESVASAG